MRNLNVSRNSGKFLKKLKNSDKSIYKSISNKVALLTENPFLEGCKKLSGHNNLYRIRVGNYRVIYKFDKDNLLYHEYR